MNVIYTTEKYKAEHPAIFLAGPSPRNDQTFTWRPQALEILEKLEFQGTVYNPEQRTPGCIDFSKSEYPAAWEHEAIWNSDVLVFWVPRHMEKLPAFTTNIEFGYFLAHPDAREKLKIIYGRPDSSEEQISRLFME
jgi:nucleoside 2-deoxyribosyltransferase